MPERDDGCFRQPLPDHARQQREVIVLDQDDGIGGLGFADHRVGEPAVDGEVGVPVRRAKDRARVRDVAQGPQAAVREPVVVPGFLLLGEPDAPDPVSRALGRHHHVIARIRRFAVGVAAAVSDPCSRARPHHRLERGHKPARGPLHLDAIVAPHVDVGLPVGNDEHFLSLQVVAQYSPERVRRPVDLALVPRPALRLEIPDQRPEIASHRPQFARGHLHLAATERFAPDDGLEAGDPAAPADFRDHHGHQRDDRSDRGEEIKDVFLRVVAAPLHEAHVVHQHQIAVGGALGFDAVNRHVDRAALEVDQTALADERITVVARAGDRRGEHRRLVDHPAGRVAETDREQALVLHYPVEEAQYLRSRAFPNELPQRILDRVRDERGADVEVAHEPLEREPVDERYDRVRDGREREGEGKDEPKRQSHADSCRVSASCGIRELRDNVARSTGRYPVLQSPPRSGRNAAHCAPNRCGLHCADCICPGLCRG